MGDWLSTGFRSRGCLASRAYKELLLACSIWLQAYESRGPSVAEQVKRRSRRAVNSEHACFVIPSTIRSEARRATLKATRVTQEAGVRVYAPRRRSTRHTQSSSSLRWPASNSRFITSALRTPTPSTHARLTLARSSCHRQPRQAQVPPARSPHPPSRRSSTHARALELRCRTSCLRPSLALQEHLVARHVDARS